MKNTKQRISMVLLFVMMFTILAEPLLFAKEAFAANPIKFSVVGDKGSITKGTKVHYDIIRGSKGELLTTTQRGYSGQKKNGTWTGMQWRESLWQFRGPDGTPAYCAYKGAPFSSKDDVYPAEMEAIRKVSSAANGKTDEEFERFVNGITRFLYPAYEGTGSLEMWARTHNPDFSKIEPITVSQQTPGTVKVLEWPNHGVIDTKNNAKKAWKQAYDTMTMLQSSAYLGVRNPKGSPAPALSGTPYQRFGAYVVWSFMHKEGAQTLRMKHKDKYIFMDKNLNSRPTGDFYISTGKDTTGQGTSVRVIDIAGTEEKDEELWRIPSAYSSVEEMAASYNMDVEELKKQLGGPAGLKYIKWGNRKGGTMYNLNQAHVIAETIKKGTPVKGNAHAAVMAKEDVIKGQDVASIGTSEGYNKNNMTTFANLFDQEIELWDKYPAAGGVQTNAPEAYVISDYIGGVSNSGQAVVVENDGTDVIFYDKAGKKLGTIPGLRYGSVIESKAGQPKKVVPRQPGKTNLTDGGVGGVFFIKPADLQTASQNSPVFEEVTVGGQTQKQIKKDARMKLLRANKVGGGDYKLLPTEQQVQWKASYMINSKNAPGSTVKMQESKGTSQNLIGNIPQPGTTFLSLSYSTPTFKLTKKAFSLDGNPVKVSGGEFSIVNADTGEEVLGGLSVDKATQQIVHSSGSLQLPDGKYQLVEKQVPKADDADMEFEIADPVSFTIPSQREIVMENKEKPKSFWVIATKVDEATREKLSGGRFRLAKISGDKRLGYVDEELKFQTPKEVTGGVIPHSEDGNYVIWEVPAEVEGAGTDKEFGGPGSYSIFEIEPPMMTGTDEKYPISSKLDWEKELAPGYIISVAKDHQLGDSWYNQYPIELENRKTTIEYGSFKFQKSIEDPADYDDFEAIFGLFEDDGTTPVDLEEASKHEDWVGDFKGGHKFAPKKSAGGRFEAYIVGLKHGASYVLKELEVKPKDYQIPSGLVESGSGVSILIKDKARYEPKTPGSQKLEDFRFDADVDYKFNNLKTDPVNLLLLKKVKKADGTIEDVPMNGLFRFEAKGADGSVYQAVNVNGQVLFKGLTKQKYIVKEIDSGGHIPDPKLVAGVEVDLTDSDKQVHRMGTYFNTAVEVGIKIHKINRYDRPIAGAVFKLKDMETGQLVGTTYETDHLGEITIKGLKKDHKYELTETKAPTGYKPLDEPIIIDTTDAEIEAGETIAYVKVDVLNEKNKGSVKLMKFDTSGNSLVGAEFKVEYLGEQKEENEVQNVVMTKDNWILEDVEPGWYRVTETKAPKGHKLDSTPQEKYLDAGKTLSFNFYNAPLTGDLEVVKKLESNPFNKSPLGAKFELRGLEDHNSYIQDTIVIDGVLSNGNGSAKTGGLPYGKYSIKEIEAPDGFHMIKDGYTEFEINDTTRVFKYESELNYPDYGYVTIQKRPYNDPTNSQNLDLSGFQFKLYRDKACTDLVDSKAFVTDKDGDTRISEKLEAGTYYFKEEVAPDGWVIDETPIPVVVKSGLSSDVPVKVVQFNRKLSNIRIIKYQEGSNKTLAGAEFEITAIEVPGLKNGEVVEILTTNSQGEAVSKDLEYGKYFIRETKRPAGYEPPSKINPGFSDPDGVAFEVGGKVKDLTYKFENKKPDEKGRLKVFKKDEDTGEFLAGAVFEVKDSKGNSLGKQTTGSSGLVEWTNLVIGETYYVYEITAPTGYEPIGKPVKVDTTGGALEFKIDVLNKKPTVPLYNLEVLKYDKENNKVLEGAVFQLYDVNNNKVGPEKTTPSNGIVRWENLPKGKYLIKEVSVPDGYQETNMSQVVELGSSTNLTERYKFGNIKKEEVKETKIVLRKFGESFDVPLEGVKFELKNLDTGERWELYTDKKGEIAVKDLKPGNYKWKELASIPGYTIGKNSEESFELKPDGEHFSEFFNDKEKPKVEINLELLKIDSETKKPLTGVKFYLRDKTRNVILGIYQTDHAGQIKVTGLEPGIYEWEEIQAPTGYEIIEQPKPIDITKGQNGQTFSTLVENRPVKVEEKVHLRLIKIDGQTRQPLAGVRFKLTNKLTGELIGIFDTNIDGEIVVSNLEPGTYIWEEIEAANGYDKNVTPLEVVATANGETVTVTRENFKKPEEPVRIKLEKFDSETGKVLQGAIFQLFNSQGQPVGGERMTDEKGVIEWINLDPDTYTVREVEAPKDYEIIGNGNFVVEATTRGESYYVRAENKPYTPEKPKIFRGALVIKKIDDSNRPLAGVDFELFNEKGESLGIKTSDENGRVRWDDLKPGEYRVEEVRTVPGFKLDERPYYIDVVRNETEEIEWINYEETTKIIINKKDKETEQPLAEATFNILDETGRIVKTATTNSDGRIEVELPSGGYTVTEVQAPKGYKILDVDQTVRLKGGDKEELTFYNEKVKGQLVINKVDVVDGSPLPNAEFVIWDETMSKEIIKGNSGPDGLAEFELEPGKYFYQEIVAPPGYVIDGAPYPFELFADGSATTCKAPNYKTEGQLLIVKKDKANDYTLANAKFIVYNEDGAEAGSGVSGTDGVVQIGLKPGTYYYQEVQAPQGYVADQTPQHFTISEKGGTQKFIHYNSRPMLAPTGDWDSKSPAEKAVTVVIVVVVLVFIAFIVYTIMNKARNKK